MPQVLTRAAMSTSGPTHPHKGLHKGHVWYFVYSLEAIGGCDSRLVKSLLLTLGLYESYLWVLDYALKSFWFVLLAIVILHLDS